MLLIFIYRFFLFVEYLQKVQLNFHKDFLNKSELIISVELLEFKACSFQNNLLLSFHSVLAMKSKVDAHDFQF